MSDHSDVQEIFERSMVRLGKEVAGLSTAPLVTQITATTSGRDVAAALGRQLVERCIERIGGFANFASTVEAFVYLASPAGIAIFREEVQSTVDNLERARQIALPGL